MIKYLLTLVKSLIKHVIENSAFSVIGFVFDGFNDDCIVVDDLFVFA